MSQIFDQLGRLALGSSLLLVAAAIVIVIAARFAPRLRHMFKHRAVRSPVAKPLLSNRTHATQATPVWPLEGRFNGAR
ncbi:hypothetical protein [Sphingomonas sp. NFR15]|uniref:hypothetical protein n=1 Tax=Sphingomonas sp. NFR15 TaxID=1566282 RepID=UPI00115FBB8E|nr:hypothetical protein [Sphingomonas sp. NFR15]